MPASSASAIRAVAPVRAAANAASNGPFHGESAGDERTAQRRVVDRRQADLSQSGTSNFAPVWHGPLLKPTFVAQVLGQVLMDNRPPPSAGGPSAYRRTAQVGSGLLLSRKI